MVAAIGGMGRSAPVVTGKRGGQGSKLPSLLTYIDPRVLFGIGQRYALGAGKYSRANWRLCPPEEHLAHAANHINTVLTMQLLGITEDDGETVEDHFRAACCRLTMAYATYLDLGDPADFWMEAPLPEVAPGAFDALAAVAQAGYDRVMTDDATIDEVVEAHAAEAEAECGGIYVRVDAYNALRAMTERHKADATCGTFEQRVALVGPVEALRERHNREVGEAMARATAADDARREEPWDPACCGSA